MANKYIIEGATNNGDGTTSSEAASNGAAGAWNTLTYAEGTAPTYGTAPAAGDTVYIRSKTSAGADITRTVGATTNFGSTAATVTAPIRWIVDGGTVWSGVAGTLTYKRTASFTWGERQFNVFEAELEDKIVFDESFSTVSGASFINLANGSVIKNGWFRFDLVTFSSGGPTGIVAPVTTGTGWSSLINPRVSLGNKWYGWVFNSGDYNLFRLINPRIELSTAFTAYPIFSTSNYGGIFEVWGGSITGAVSGVVLCVAMTANSGGIRLFGTQVPKTMVWQGSAAPGIPGGSIEYDAIGADSGLGAVRNRRWGTMDSRSDGYYPTLNAVYPGAGSPAWAWRVYPVSSTMFSQMDIPFFKFYSDAAAAKTITANFLLGDAFSGAHKGSVWLDVHYIDNATGLTKFQTTYLPTSVAALDASTAGWSATTWGAINLVKKNIAITTATSIKADTLVTVVLRGIAKSVSANDILFVDGDVEFT
jgi:hypothetical protein